MYFVTYQYASFSEAGILTPDKKKIIPLSTLGRIIDQKLPDQLTDFIAMADDKLIDDLTQAVASHDDMGIHSNGVKYLAPIPHPERNIFCLGKNYQNHVKELNTIPNLQGNPADPIYFSKLSSSVVGPNSNILSHANMTKEVDYEVELAVIIGKEGINIQPEEAEDYIFGYTIANDITARDLQKKHAQWYKGKSLDTFCPMGPVLVHKNALPLPLDLNICCTVNGEMRQSSTTANMIFDIPFILSDLSQGVTLKPGDIILTGTPGGVGAAMNPPQFLTHGDVIESEIQGIGILRNTIN